MSAKTNIFAPQPHETEPLYGVFGGLEGFHSSLDSIHSLHTYTVDWNSERIIWSVDGRHARTVQKCKCINLDSIFRDFTKPPKAETKKNGVLHYPSHPMRIQLGIWDASAPEGTSEWGKGPIDWSKVPSQMLALFKSVRLECS
jgi:beta-glucanase (GH16 family)